MGSVREATFEVARQHGMTTWFGNPGSTEIPLLADLPDDMRYVLALHENAAVGAAAGYAIASDRPAMVSLHTTAGLGNAVNSLATARGVRVDRLAGALGVPSVRVSAVEQLVEVLDEVMPGLRERDQPLVVDVRLDAAQ
jgi:thiamine pyrophosphate-dependent acetolactate synthase large subunit-like protein